MLSRIDGKRGLVELTGTSSAKENRAPVKKKQNINLFKINRIKYGNKDFCYFGTVDNKSCLFKLNTGSDISTLNSRIVSLLRKRIPVSDCKLRYPTGEEVNVKFKVNVWIELGKFSLEFPMLVADK